MNQLCSVVGYMHSCSCSSLTRQTIEQLLISQTIAVCETGGSKAGEDGGRANQKSCQRGYSVARQEVHGTLAVPPVGMPSGWQTHRRASLGKNLALGWHAFRTSRPGISWLLPDYPSRSSPVGSRGRTHSHSETLTPSCWGRDIALVGDGGG